MKAGKLSRKARNYDRLGSESRKSCQEKPGIVTGWAVKAEKVSRKAGNYDRLGSGSRKAVKKSREL